MRKISYSVHVVLVLLGIIGFWQCRPHQKGIKPRYRQINESVYASVTVQPKNLYNVYAVHQGIIDELSIEEGDRVSDGQVLAKLQTIDPRLDLQDADLLYKLAKEQYKGEGSELAALRKEMALLETQVKVDSQNFVRQSRLWEQNIGSRTALENAELKYKSSVKNLDVLHAQYDQTEQKLESAYDRARIGLQQAKTNLEDFTIASRLNGCVYEVLKDEGERVMLQEPIARIGLCDTFVLEMLVDEVDIARIKTGQLVIVHLDAYPNEVYEAHVTRIFPSKNIQTQTFTVEASFGEQPPALYSGLGGEANIVITSMESALTIPIEYLKDGNAVVTPDGEIAVTRGLQNLEFVEILDGIDTSTVLLKPDLK